MWKYLIIWCFLSHVTVRGKEELFGQELSTDILKEIRKRLDQPPRQCDSIVRNVSTIIRTNESLAAGATFIVSKKVDSEFDCRDSCCRSSECNLAIYEAKEVDDYEARSLCYLFNCGFPNKCVFTHHRKYVTLSMKGLARRKGTHTVNDLQGLSKHFQDMTEPAKGDDYDYKPEHSKDEDQEEKEPARPTPTTTTTTTTEPTTTTTTKAPTTTTTTTSAPRIVQMLHHCRPEDTCAGARTACVDAFCRCEEGYHPKNGVCREDCKDNVEFECLNGNASITGPDCIAIYDTCDGIAQCSDGSDETFCSEKVPIEEEGKDPKVNTDNASLDSTKQRPTESKTTDSSTDRTVKTSYESHHNWGNGKPSSSEDDDQRFTKQPTGTHVSSVSNHPKTAHNSRINPISDKTSHKPGSNIKNNGKPGDYDYYGGGYNPFVGGGKKWPSLSSDSSSDHVDETLQHFRKNSHARTDLRKLGSPSNRKPSYDNWRSDGSEEDDLDSLPSSGTSLLQDKYPSSSANLKPPVKSVLSDHPRPDNVRPQTENIKHAQDLSKISQAHSVAGKKQPVKHDKVVPKPTTPRSSLDMLTHHNSGSDVFEDLGDRHQNVQPSKNTRIYGTQRAKTVKPYWALDKHSLLKEPDQRPPWIDNDPRSSDPSDFTRPKDESEWPNHGVNTPESSELSKPESGARVPSRRPQIPQPSNDRRTRPEFPSSSRGDEPWVMEPQLPKSRQDTRWKNYDYYDNPNLVDQLRKPVYHPSHKSNNRFANTNNNRGNYGGNPIHRQPYRNFGRYEPNPVARPQGRYPSYDYNYEYGDGNNRYPPASGGKTVPDQTVTKEDHHEVEVHGPRVKQPYQPKPDKTSPASKVQSYSTIPAPTTSSEPVKSSVEESDEKQSTPIPTRPQTTKKYVSVASTTEKENKVDSVAETTPEVKPQSKTVSDTIDKEVEPASRNDSEAQGAIIALSLGLSITALLLLFIGCRYRNMKRRIRRGRPLDSNEADYLINGMYL